jgi:hypothetical protein
VNTEKSRTRLVLCIRNQGSEDLEPRKVYQVLPERAAVREGYMRVIDESGEDYLYPAEYFVPAALPLAITRVPASSASEAVPPKAHKRRRA